MKSHVNRVDSFLKKMGDLGPLDDDGVCVLIKGNARLQVEVFEDDDLLSVSSTVLTVPNQNILPLFRKALELNFKDTRDAAFSLDDAANKIVLRIRRPLENLDYEEFVRAVETVADVADEYNDMLAEEFGAELEPVKRKTSTLQNYLNAINPVRAHEVAQQKEIRNRRVGTILYFLGIVIGAASGIVLYLVTDSIPLGIFIYLWVYFFVARTLPSIISDPHKLKRLVFFLLYPAIATGVLFLVQWAWGIWWLSVLLGCIAGWFIPPIIGAILMPKILEEESEEDVERLKKMFSMYGSLKDKT